MRKSYKYIDILNFTLFDYFVRYFLQLLFSICLLIIFIFGNDREREKNINPGGSVNLYQQIVDTTFDKFCHA